MQEKQNATPTVIKFSEKNSNFELQVQFFSVQFHQLGLVPEEFFILSPKAFQPQAFQPFSAFQLFQRCHKAVSSCQLFQPCSAFQLFQLFSAVSAVSALLGVVINIPFSAFQPQAFQLFLYDVILFPTPRVLVQVYYTHL